MSNLSIKSIEVAPIRTDCSQMELVQALIAAWYLAFNSVPSKRQIAIIWAHYALEHGLAVSMFNHNLGNLHRVYGDGKHPCYVLPFAGSPLFLSFDSLLDGSKSYLLYLKEKKFPKAWQAIEKGNLVSFVSLLKKDEYFVSLQKDYMRAMMMYFGKFMGSGLYEQAGSVLDAFEMKKPKTFVPLWLAKCYQQIVAWFRHTI